MTPNQVKALDFVRDRITRSGFAPTLGEIADHLGLSGRSRAHGVVNELVATGHLRREAHKLRGLALPGMPDLRAVDTEALQAELARRGVEPGAFSADERRTTGGHDVACAIKRCGIAVPRGHMFCRSHYWAIGEATRQELFAAHRAFSKCCNAANERRYHAAYVQAVAEATGRRG